ncbi:MAG: hypothetical protein WAM82_02530, partial [Thermoanaerobaculia bacterium]
ERTLPLPLELCVGMNTEQGTALYVTYGINPDPDEPNEESKNFVWGDDLAGWMVISPFPPSIIQSGKLMRLDVHVNNKAGAFRDGVTQVVAAAGGTFLCMEVLGTGDMGSLILLPGDRTAPELRKEVEKQDEVVLGVEERRWKLGDSSSQLGWITSLFPSAENENKEGFKPVIWSEDQRVMVRDRQITVPFGRFWHDYNYDRAKERKAVQKVPENPHKSNYCLLARDMELPVLLALFPSRPLFRIDLDVSGEARLWNKPQTDVHQVGNGMLNEAVNELSAQSCNIWHVQNTYRSLLFEPRRGKHDPPVLRSVDSRISIVASVPKQRKYDRPEVIASYLGELRRRLLRLRLKPTGEVESDILDAVRKTPTDVAEKISEGLETLNKRVGEMRDQLGDLPEESVSQASVFKMMRRVVDEHVQGILNRIEPSFVKNVDIHGPPLFRCFFSHSARPAYDERDHIDRLKLLLESEVFEIIEGEFSLGMSTEALSRGKIRHCDLFVSFLWPREDFRKEKGEYMPPEWVIHEESFAIGQGIPVYRVREQGVMPPRYEKDRLEFLFTKGDMDTWKSLEHLFRLEIRQLVQQILVGMKPTTQGRDKEAEG